MHIEVDLSAVPPVVVMRDADDFRSFKVVVLQADHTRVPPGVIEQLAGERAASADWQEGFKSMLQYADQHGWVDDSGVRAHTELR